MTAGHAESTPHGDHTWYGFEQLFFTAAREDERRTPGEAWERACCLWRHCRPIESVPLEPSDYGRLPGRAA